MVNGKYRFLNTCINSISSSKLLEELDQRIASGKETSVVFVNVDVVIRIEKNPLLKQAVDAADYVLLDGMPLVWISKLYRQPVKEKISGSDFIPALLKRCAQKQYSVFLAGGREDVSQSAEQNIRRDCPGIRIAGRLSPPLGFEKDAAQRLAVNQAVTDAAPDVLVMCFGCPKQEIYIHENRKDYRASLSICGGGTIDFLAGNIRRCPPWMSRCGLEWFYRFLQEPSRLFKRYFIDDVKILALAWKYRPGKKSREERDGA